MVLVTKGGETLFKSAYKTPLTSGEIINSIQAQIANCQIRYGLIERMGIGLSEELYFDGSCDSLHEAIKHFAALNTFDFNLKRDLIGMAQAAAIAEAKHASSNNKLLGVVLDVGCGIGFVDEQGLVTESKTDNQWAHSPLPAFQVLHDGLTPVCRCGQENCLEQFLTVRGFERQYHQLVLKHLTMQDIFAAIEQHEAQATRVYRMYVDQLARALSNSITQLLPTQVVLFGALSRYAKLADDLKAALTRYCDIAVIPRVSSSALSHFTSAYGATLSV